MSLPPQLKRYHAPASGWLTGLLWLSLGCVLHAGIPATAYNFAGPEIYPINNSIAQLHAADLNGDGLNDLIVADNQNYRIDLLYNRTGKTNAADGFIPPASWSANGVNQLPPDARFHLDSIPVDEQISDLEVADLNGDGRPDMIYYGDGKDLEIVYNRGTNGWSNPQSWHLDDGLMTADALAVGDLNGDGRPDLVLLAEDGFLYFLAQQPDHTFAPPQKIFCSDSPKAVQIVDVNGDGRKDLLLVDWDSPTPFQIRLQNAAGQLGPEIYFKTHPIHAYSANHLDESSNLFVTAIAQSSDRAEVLEFARHPAEVLSGHYRRGQFQVLPLRRSGAVRRGLLWADVNGDGRPDLLAADPESGQLEVYLQQPDGTLGPRQIFSALSGVSQIAAADWHRHGRKEIFLLSQSERAVGMTSLQKNGDLPFPTLLPLEGKPLLMAVGRLRHGARPALCILTDRKGRRYLEIRTAAGKTRIQKLSASFTDDPTTMAVEDVNQDGLPDIVMLIPYDKVKVLLQKPDGTFDEEDVDPPGGPMAQPWLASADVDGDGKPELLLPQNNFVRAVVLEKETETLGGTNRTKWVFRVKDQINGASSDSQITGATTIRTGRNSPPSIFLLDSQHKQLTFCQKDKAGVWRVVRNLPLPVSGFAGLQTVALGGEGVSSVAMAGPNDVAWMPLAGKVWELKALDDYDTPIENGYLNDVVAGDLTGDGREDLVFMETAKHYLDIVHFNSRQKLVPAIRWQVFEEHTFRSDSSNIPQPREALIADVTGDGRKDLVVLVHDRILVYPQR